jgi:hypothetical protein
MLLLFCYKYGLIEQNYKEVCSFSFSINKYYALKIRCLYFIIILPSKKNNLILYRKIVELVFAQKLINKFKLNTNPPTSVFIILTRAKIKILN